MVVCPLSKLCKSEVLFDCMRALRGLLFCHPVGTDYAGYTCVRLCLLLISAIVYVCALIGDEILISYGTSIMGNENSSIPSDNTTTPTSDWQSVCSYGSRRRSSLGSVRMPSPVDAPEPDLSHLTAEEISQIQAVIDRAKEVQSEEHLRIR